MAKRKFTEEPCPLVTFSFESLNWAVFISVNLYVFRKSKLGFSTLHFWWQVARSSQSLFSPFFFINQLHTVGDRITNICYWKFCSK